MNESARGGGVLGCNAVQRLGGRTAGLERLCRLVGIDRPLAIVVDSSVPEKYSKKARRDCSFSPSLAENGRGYDGGGELVVPISWVVLDGQPSWRCDSGKCAETCYVPALAHS